MDPELYRRANDLLLEVLDLPPSQRTAFLERHCDDPALRREVDSLLAADSCFGDLSTPALELLDDNLGPGDMLGSYTLEGELGRGGMGVVYLAQRSDGEFERQVALKVLKRGMDTDAVIRRFKTERQILARLHHPNIAELYEGGTTPDHRPFLVMERVVGQPIDRYCDQRGLGLVDRVELFLTVCEAVEFAHQNLVVHRDLKPSNILVDEQGNPKLLDFGIAKLLVPEGADPYTETEAGWAPMTLEYASPEQVEGRSITTSTDIYSLGVLLFELLTGRRPYRLENNTQEELRRAILLDDPERPSTAVRDQPGRSKDRRRLRGDLDHILGMVLEKKPRLRYASVGQLASDLRQHLEGRPVRARANTPFYRASRFVRRHGRWVLLAVTLFAMVLGFAIDRTLQQRETARQRDRAEKVRDFLIELFDLPASLDAEQRAAKRKMLDQGLLDLEERSQKLDDPDLRATVKVALAQGYHGLGLLDKAEAVALAACAERRTLRGDHHVEIAECLELLSALDRDFGRLEAATDKANRAHAIYLDLLGESDELTIESREVIAVLRMDQGRYGDAEPLMHEVLDLKLRYRVHDTEGIAQTEGNLGLVLYYQGRYGEAEPLLRRAWNRTRQKTGEQSGAAAAHRTNLAATLRALGRNSEAEDHSVALVELRRAQGNPAALATALNNLAMLYLDLRREEEAIELFEEATELTLNTQGDARSRLVSIYTNLATIHHQLGQLEAAEERACLALDLALEMLGDDHTRTASARVVLASVLLDRRQPRAAEALARHGLETFERHLERTTWRTAWARTILGSALLELGRNDEARPLLDLGLEGLLLTKGPEAPTTWRAAETLARLYRSTGRSALAEETLRRLAPD